jgi:hypothetical protein
MIIELVRFAYLPDCTLGFLDADNIKLATIERPWIPDPDGPGGQPRESCIPDGTYHVSPWNSDRFPNTFILTNPFLGVYRQPGDVPAGQKHGRSAILIHAGNRVQDVIGCIAVGVRHSFFSQQHAVLESRKALDQLRTVLGKETHSLVIRPTKGTEE